MKSTGREPDRPFDQLVARGLARAVDASGAACPDADLLAAWFDHTLSTLESERIETHAAGCQWCQQTLAALARSEPEVIRAAPLPAPPRAWHWHWRWAVPLATAVLVVAVGTRTLRAPGPVAPPVAPPDRGEPVSILAAPEKSPAVSRTGANVPAAQVADKQAPSQLPVKSDAAARPAAAPSETPARLAATPAPSAPPPPPPPARVEAAPVLAPPAAAPAAVSAPQAMKLESRKAEQAQRRADVASDKLLKASAPAAAPVTSPVPPVAQSVAVVGGSAPLQAFGSLSVRRASVTTSMLAGSAVAWRFGQDGVIEKSSDRGQTWVRQSSGVTTPLLQASAPSDRVCWIVGAGGVVLRTTDGVTWQQVTAPTGVDLVAVRAWNELAATVTASDRSDYETTDGGKSWKHLR